MKNKAHEREKRRCAAMLKYLDNVRRGFEREGRRDTGIHIENGRNSYVLASCVRDGHVEAVQYNGRTAHRITPEGIKELEPKP